jgi:hypothetical protein
MGRGLPTEMMYFVRKFGKVFSADEISWGTRPENLLPSLTAEQVGLHDGNTEKWIA